VHLFDPSQHRLFDGERAADLSQSSSRNARTASLPALSLAYDWTCADCIQLQFGKSCHILRTSTVVQESFHPTKFKVKMAKNLMVKYIHGMYVPWDEYIPYAACKFFRN